MSSRAAWPRRRVASRLAALACLLAACAPVQVEISPARPHTDDPLVADLREAPSEAIVRWLRDGVPVTTGPFVPADQTHRGERWEVRVEVDGEVAASDAVVVQGPPAQVSLSLPGSARRGEALVAELQVDSEDEVELRWTWRRDGEAVTELRSDTVPGHLLHEGERWTAHVEVQDGPALITAEAGPALVQRPGALFELAGVRQIELRLPPASRLALLIEPERWATADLRVDGVALLDVGVRLKGRASFEAINERPALLLDLDRHVDGQHLDGLDELVLNNMHADPTQVHERLAYATFHAAGLPAPRTAHARLVIDGRDKGLYTLAEQVDGRFLYYWFGDGSGPLFEMPGVELDEPGVMALDHDGGPDDRTVLLELAHRLAMVELGLRADLSDLLDTDELARYLAVCGVIAHYDGYPHNLPGDDLYLYVSPLDRRAHLIAHGADEAFGDPLRPVDYAPGLLARACVTDPSCRDSFRQATLEVLDLVEATELAYTAVGWTRIAEPVVEQGPQLRFSRTERVQARGKLWEMLAQRRETLSWMWLQ